MVIPFLITVPLPERDEENTVAIKGMVQVSHAHFRFICQDIVTITWCVPPRLAWAGSLSINEVEDHSYGIGGGVVFIGYPVNEARISKSVLLTVQSTSSGEEG